MTEKHIKYDEDKPRLALVPPSLIMEVGKVLTFGAAKYTPNNWRLMEDTESTISAIDRHFCAWKSGEDLDPESGLSHLSHMATNIAFLLELQHLPRTKKEIK